MPTRGVNLVEEKVRGIGVALLCACATVMTVVPASAAGGHRGGTGQGAHSTTIDWNQHDTAVYVVSTINLLRTHRGQPLTNVLQNRMGVRRYNVYADFSVTDMYYIDLARADGSVAGTLAYRMGWQKPMSLSPTMDRLRIGHASDLILTAYRTDRKTLIGSFSSTFPS